MRIELKPIEEQVIVIVGASSGIGLVTATMAAERGASVVLAARNGDDLQRAVSKIRATGGRAISVVADVADFDQVAAIGAAAIEAYGRIDTWINNAGTGLYGYILDVSLEDMRRQFDVNYWGQVHGCRVAVEHLRRHGGAIVNVASALADRAIPLQGNYCATKHALKAFTDTLRMELEADGLPISVSLVKPGSVDTPLFEKSKTYFAVEPQPVPPVAKPRITARAILACAERPIRDIVTSGMGRLIGIAGAIAPRLTDRFMERSTIPAQLTDRPVLPDRPDNLRRPLSDDGGTRGRNYTGRVKGTSLYMALALHPRVAVGITLGAAAAALGLKALLRRDRVGTTSD